MSMTDDSDENVSDFVKAATNMLDGVWKIANELGYCPICMVELMYDMVTNAEEAGKIQHLGATLEDDDDEPEPTHEGPCTHQ